jgi:DNA-binding transcriptional ArsR family regulator
MVDHSHKQQEALKDETRMKLYELLRVAEAPMSGSLIWAQKPFNDLSLAKIVYHLTILEQAGLVALDGACWRAKELD